MITSLKCKIPRFSGKKENSMIDFVDLDQQKRIPKEIYLEQFVEYLDGNFHYICRVLAIVVTATGLIIFVT